MTRTGRKMWAKTKCKVEAEEVENLEDGDVETRRGALEIQVGL